MLVLLLKGFTPWRASFSLSPVSVGLRRLLANMSRPTKTGSRQRQAPTYWSMRPAGLGV